MAATQQIPHPEQHMLQQIAEGTAGTVGAAFFRELVKSLAQATGFYGAWVTEYLEREERLRALAFWLNNDFVSSYEYAIAGTPCESALKCDGIFEVPEKVMELFPKDPDLKPLGAVSYLGVALRDLDGKILGHLALLHNKPLHRRIRIATIFRIYAARAAAELQRLQAEQQLSESEGRLHRLVNGIHDSILEVDEHLSITQANTAALNNLLLSTDQLENKSLKHFLSLESLKKISGAILKLSRASQAGPHYRIPGVIEVVNAGNESFPAESTLTQYTANNQNFYVLIFRNVKEIKEAEEKIHNLSVETELLREEIMWRYNLDEIVGSSHAIAKAMELVEQVAPTDGRVLITGETGTGKELIARAIHKNSKRSKQPLVKINCAALPANLIESELFGHEKGAFTGALIKREGKFKLADKGTIFLDEVGELPLELQPKILRVLQEGEFDPVGSNVTQKVDVRVIAATNRNLLHEVKAGRFREDLYYRLNVFPILSPSLRERGMDVLQLANFFLQQFSRQFNKKVNGFTEEDKQQLLAYSWPGNVRELQSVIERSVITSNNGKVNLTYLPTDVIAAKPVDAIHFETSKIYTAEELKELEKQNILNAIKTCQGKISGPDGAAVLLDIPATTLTSKIKSLRIEKFWQ